MKVAKLSPRTKYTFTLAKIDGDIRETIAVPEKDPRCSEVRQWTLGEPNKLIYKREN